jgi:FlaA1/EpsC-like NDP-sugar epimerase
MPLNIFPNFNLPAKNTPRWVIFGFDLIISAFSLVLAYLLRFNFSIPASEIRTLPLIIAFLLSLRGSSFYLFKTFAGIIRYTSSKDAQRVLLAITTTSVFCILLNIINYFIGKRFVIPFSIILIEYFITTFIMTVFRFTVKMIYFETKNPNKTKTNIIIYGAGESGIITKRTLDRDEGTRYKVLAYVDDDASKVGKKVEGVTIHHFNTLEELLKGNSIAHLVISIQNLPNKRKQEIVDTCLAYNTKVLNVPPVQNWIKGELSFKQIKKIKIEDLLERDPILLDINLIQKQLKGKRVLITGAAGSIGSEIVRQIVPFNPSKIIILDQSESALYDIELEMLEKHKSKTLETVIGDIRNQERMNNVFNTFKPEIVYHAAAYKHVPMMENNPSESILTNVEGTKIIADLSVKYAVEKFVFISTDKAVNPSNIMGATKRIAEIYIQSLNSHQGTTKFITTRFGNVLGSNGSVIPRFRKQIEAGGPITITHPDITRFFMTIPEACQLVLEAGSMGNGGEIFLFDMGQLVRIVDLAKKMIRLSGLTLGKDIEIAYTGLRPGEKLYEELLNDQENTLPTHHSKITVAKIKEYEFESISKAIDELISLFPLQNNMNIVSKMKQIVPEFISNNSMYEVLDKPGAAVSS